MLIVIFILLLLNLLLTFRLLKKFTPMLNATITQIQESANRDLREQALMTSLRSCEHSVKTLDSKLKI